MVEGGDDRETKSQRNGGRDGERVKGVAALGSERFAPKNGGARWLTVKLCGSEKKQGKKRV